MYYYLSKEVKRKLIYELKEIFKNYPGLDKVKVSDKFPYDERPQYGVIVENTSHSTLPLSADNFIATMKSYCFLASLKGKKGLMIDWVRENPNDITKFFKDDLSSQVVGTSTQIFNLAWQPVEGNGNIAHANSPNQVKVHVNGRHVETHSLNGQKLILKHPAMATDTVIAEYNIRKLAKAGLYYIELIELGKPGSPGKVVVDPLYYFNETIIQKTTGTETTYELPYPIFKNTLDLSENGLYLLREGLHYTLSGQTITFLPNPSDVLSGQTLRPGQKLIANYRYQGPTLGTFDVLPAHTTEILPGVTIAFSYFLEVGDKQVVIVTDTREDSANEFGGNFDTNLTLNIYARDPMQRELIADLMVVQIFGLLKPIFDASGLLIVSADITGENEEMYNDITDTVYYGASIDLKLTTDWRLYAPLLPKLKFINLDIEAVVSLSSYKASFIPGKEDYR